MEKVGFSDLRSELKIKAVSQMVRLKKERDWPADVGWETERELIDHLENQYHPDIHFTFYIDKGELITTPKR